MPPVAKTTLRKTHSLMVLPRLFFAHALIWLCRCGESVATFVRRLLPAIILGLAAQIPTPPTAFSPTVFLTLEAVLFRTHRHSLGPKIGICRGTEARRKPARSTDAGA